MNVREPGFKCPECVDAAPYVLGALADTELSAYEEHLRDCAACRAQVTELQVVADMLPVSVPPAAASAQLHGRVMATVRAEAELLQAAGEQADRPAKPAGRWRSRRLPLATAGAAIAAAVAVAVVIAIGSSSSGERVTTAQHITASAPGARATLRQRDGRAELVVSGMPQPPRGKIYEVWLSRGAGSAEPTDALFSVTRGGRGSVAVPHNLRGIKEVMVTSEPLGGSSQPTGPPLIRVAL
jgi:anti-sigma-K factor RskA